MLNSALAIYPFKPSIECPVVAQVVYYTYWTYRFTSGYVVLAVYTFFLASLLIERCVGGLALLACCTLRPVAFKCTADVILWHDCVFPLQALLLTGTHIHTFPAWFCTSPRGCSH